MAYEKQLFTVSLEAEVDMTEKQYNAVKVSNDFKCNIAATSEDVIGVVINNPRQGLAAAVLTNGISKIKVADGQTITAGKGIAITNGEASGDGNIGVALETITGPGIGTVLLGVVPGTV